MLLPTSRTAPGLSRRAVLGIGTAGALACLLPALRYVPVQAEPQPGPADAKTKGRIYVHASLRDKPLNAILAIDPSTGTWQKIADKGHNGRVSPDRQTLAFSRDDGIWNCDTGGTNPRRVSDKSGRPIWSPDGKYLVATKQQYLVATKQQNDAARWKCETWRVDAANGANPTRLPILDSDWVDDWSPDGQWFVLGTDRHPPHGRGYQLYILKTDGTQQRRLTEGG